MMYVLPLWVHCVDYQEMGEFVFRRENLDRLQQDWKAWVGDRASSLTLFPFPW